MKNLFGIITACLFVAGAFAGCVGSDENVNTEEMTLLAKTGEGEWTNETVTVLVSEVITDGDMATPDARTKTVQEISFMLKDVSAGAEVVWDYGDLTTETAGIEATHTYANPGSYLVVANVGGTEVNTTAVVNYHSSGSGSVATHPGATETAFEEGTSYFNYLFTVYNGAKRCEIDLVGTPEVEQASDIDLLLYDPSSKEVATATTEEVNEHITVKKMRSEGNYVCRIGQYSADTDSLYIQSIGNVDYTFTIDVLYA